MVELFLIHAINSGGYMGKVEQAIDKMIETLMYIGHSQNNATELVHNDIERAKKLIDDHFEYIEDQIDSYIEAQVDSRGV